MSAQADIFIIGSPLNDLHSIHLSGNMQNRLFDFGFLEVTPLDLGRVILIIQ
jgi:hypothetical protein